MINKSDIKIGAVFYTSPIKNRDHDIVRIYYICQINDRFIISIILNSGKEIGNIFTHQKNFLMTMSIYHLL